MLGRRESDKSQKKEKKQRRKLKAPTYNYPNVTFDGSQAVDIPVNPSQSPVATHLSLMSNPAEFKFMDEIALLKRGKIDKDAPKHPYNRNSIQNVVRSESESSEPQTTGSSMTSTTRSSKCASLSLLGGTPENKVTIPIGKDGCLKHSQIKEGGERYELSCEEMMATFQQTEGQTLLVTFKIP